ALGLGCHKRIQERVGEKWRRTRSAVTYLDGERLAVLVRFESHHTTLARGLDGIQGQIQSSGPQSRFLGNHFQGWAVSADLECDLGVFAGGADEQGDLAK